MWWSEDTLWESALSFHHLASADPAQLPFSKYNTWHIVSICARCYRVGCEGSPSAPECVRWGSSMICREVIWQVDSTAVGVAREGTSHLRCNFTSSVMGSEHGAASYNPRPQKAAMEGSSQAPGCSEFLASWCYIVDPPSEILEVCRWTPKLTTMEYWRH